jgi:hypothetical protein
MRPVLLPLPFLLVAALATGCSGDDASTTPSGLDTTTSPSGDPSPSATTGASPAPDGAESQEPSERSEQAFGADRAQDTAPAEGNGLSVVDVRTGRHEGYDRVVFELAGEGTPGWSVEYDDAPAEQGSGEPVELAGEAALSVLITGVGYPFDTGVEQYGGPRELTPGLPVVREVQLKGVFEGQYDAFVGVAQDRPFRVFRLADPQRVVLDVAHTG